jgi:hypothetical protein
MAKHHAKSPECLTPRPKKPQPTSLHHRPTGLAYCRGPDGKGGQQTVYPGAYGSPESKVEYRRLLAKLDAAASPAVVLQEEAGLNAVRDILVFRSLPRLLPARRADGTPTNELPRYRQTFRAVLHRGRASPRTSRPACDGPTSPNSVLSPIL